jgi:hypothetical protein
VDGTNGEQPVIGIRCTTCGWGRVVATQKDDQYRHALALHLIRSPTHRLVWPEEMDEGTPRLRAQEAREGAAYITGITRGRRQAADEIAPAIEAVRKGWGF